MQQCVFISIFVESHNLNLMHMKQKLVRIGISGIQKQKRDFALYFLYYYLYLSFPHHLLLKLSQKNIISILREEKNKSGLG